VSERVLWGGGGLYADVLSLGGTLKFHANLYELREGRPMGPRTVSRVLANLLYKARFSPFFLEPIVAGLDNEGKPYICSSDCIGAVDKEKPWAAVGTAASEFTGMAETVWRPDLADEELFDTVSQCALAALDRNALSGWGAVVHVVNKDGIVSRKIWQSLD
jgi:20S proteasome subunit beta 3